MVLTALGQVHSDAIVSTSTEMRLTVSPTVVAARGIGTAADVVCTRGEAELVLVELKTGFGGDRTRSAGTCMQKPLAKAKDSHINRHFAQLAVTLHLFNEEASTLAKLRAKGVDRVSGCVLYVDGDVSEKFALPSWWERRGERIVARIS